MKAGSTGSSRDWADFEAGLFYNAVWAAHHLLFLPLHRSQRGAPVWFLDCLSDRMYSEWSLLNFKQDDSVLAAKAVSAVWWWLCALHSGECV